MKPSVDQVIEQGRQQTTKLLGTLELELHTSMLAGALAHLWFCCLPDRRDLRLPHLSRFSEGGLLRTRIPGSFVTARNFTRLVKVDYASTPPSPLWCRIPFEAPSPQRLKPRSTGELYDTTEVVPYPSRALPESYTSRVVHFPSCTLPESYTSRVVHFPCRALPVPCPSRLPREGIRSRVSSHTFRRSRKVSQPRLSHVSRTRLPMSRKRSETWGTLCGNGAHKHH